jgi:AcrR family transcriptional regulator
VSEIAARAEVNETTIYRRWGTRENLLIDALLDATEQLRVPDTGSLRDDLVAYAVDLAEFLATPVGHALERTLAVAGDDPDTRRARDRYWASRAALSTQMIVRAVDRGELPATVDPDLAIEMLVSPVHFRILLTREPVDDRMPARLVDALLGGIGGIGGAGGTAPDP